MKIMSIIGARPQLIKAATVSRILRQTEGVHEILVHTGQHYDDNMSEIFFKQLDIPKPDLNLAVGSASHGAQTGCMLEKIEKVLVTKKPDWVLVYGDTNSTLAGALAAAKLQIRIAHIEAGLRSFNRRMPEEINRVLTDHVGDLLFAPTSSAVKHLIDEGISREKIELVGDVMYDAALYYAGKATKNSSIILSRLKLKKQGYVLATIHRAENTDNPKALNAILQGLADFSSTEGLPVVLPLHPRTRQAIDIGGIENQEALRLLPAIEPLGYLEMLILEKNALLIATDSGGVQKEAFFFKVPCATLREETEWVELIDSGWNRLVAPIASSQVSAMLTEIVNSRPGEDTDLYGDGQSAVKIVETILRQ